MSIDDAFEAVRAAINGVPKERRSDGAGALELASRAADEAKAPVCRVLDLIAWEKGR